MSHVVVTYRPRPDRADENRNLIENVFEELAARAPEGLRYASFRLEDGTFVHIAETEVDPNPLSSLVAFQAFTRDIKERCAPDAGPQPRGATLIGNYRLLAD